MGSHKLYESLKQKIKEELKIRDIANVKRTPHIFTGLKIERAMWKI
jgi:hypothetical protein